MGNPRFSSSTPGRDPVVDRYWLPLEPGWVAGAVQRVEGRALSAPGPPHSEEDFLSQTRVLYRAGSKLSVSTPIANGNLSTVSYNFLALTENSLACIDPACSDVKSNVPMLMLHNSRPCQLRRIIPVGE